MPRAVSILAVLVSLLGLQGLNAGRPEVFLKIGDPGPAWVNLPGIDGKKHSLADLKDKDVLVVVFTCNSCPIAEDYEERINAFDKKFCGPDSKVALVAINVNVIPEDRLPKMQERAKKRGFTFAYLYDETQKIARAYGAIYTPEFFVLGKDRKLVYKGAMDDKNSAKLAKENYLEPAVLAALQGVRPTIAETAGRGCMVRYVRKKE